ncbi:MAG: hypothetical protein WB439_03695 [Acidobacteriaceae bacterium]
MNAWKGWPFWAKMLLGTLLAYSLLLCVVSLAVFVQAIKSGSPLHASDFCMQALMLAFFPLLAVALWRPRIAAGLLFAAVAINIGLLIATRNQLNQGAAVATLSSVAFLGVPMLGAAIFLTSLSRLPQS